MNDTYPLRLGRGNKTFNGGEPPMEARLAKLEASMEHVQRDVSEIKTSTGSWAPSPRAN